MKSVYSDSNLKIKKNNKFFMSKFFLKSIKIRLFFLFTIVALFFVTELFPVEKTSNSQKIEGTKDLILKSDHYFDDHIKNIHEQLTHRIEIQPFNAIALIIFILALTHTFFARKITLFSNQLKKKLSHHTPTPFQLFLMESLHFMGEVEVILGIWVIPLLFAMTYFFDWKTTLQYLDSISYIEPLFVVVMMALASTKPILHLAEVCLNSIAKIGRSSIQSYWWTILTIGPLLGSFITEAASMTICALLLGKQFYTLNPSKKFAYASLGLLFTNISVGGVLTNYAAPPVLMVVKSWNYSSSYMFKTFGIKAIVGIVASNLFYWLLFKNEFQTMEKNRKKINKIDDQENEIPLWITICHLLFLIWIVINLHNPVVFIGSFLLYLGFYKATLPFQNNLDLKTPVLVGFFLASLIIHGNLQEWWLEPLLRDVSKEFLMAISLVLTAFNDNAQITFLASLMPNFNEEMKYAIMVGAVTGGGLTIIANAPNLVGQSFLKHYFKDGISAWNLFLSALMPTIIIASIFYLFQP